jgi:hypothetical protein
LLTLTPSPFAHAEVRRSGLDRLKKGKPRHPPPPPRGDGTMQALGLNGRKGRRSNCRGRESGDRSAPESGGGNERMWQLLHTLGRGGTDIGPGARQGGRTTTCSRSPSKKKRPRNHPEPPFHKSSLA